MCHSKTDDLADNCEGYMEEESGERGQHGDTGRVLVVITIVLCFIFSYTYFSLIFAYLYIYCLSNPVILP